MEQRLLQRLKWLEEVLGTSLELSEFPLSTHPSQNVIILGMWEGSRWGVTINRRLSQLELELLKRLSEEWMFQESFNNSATAEELLLQWLRESRNGFSPETSSLLKQFNWEIERVPIAFISLNTDRKPITRQLLEVIESYFSPESIYLPYDHDILICLAPAYALSPEETDSFVQQEWLSGLYDLCQTELPHPIQILYHNSFRKPDELRARVQDLIQASKVFQWSLPANKPLAPWNLIPELIIQDLSKEKRKQILDLIRHKGGATLLSQPEWIHTLTVFFRSNLNISLAAKELYIHRNTLLYRLDRLVEEIGLDPRTFKDAFIIQMILYLLSMERNEQNEQ
jgi:DNA-binding PucR family transcriptional regulator